MGASYSVTLTLAIQRWVYAPFPISWWGSCTDTCNFLDKENGKGMQHNFWSKLIQGKLASTWFSLGTHAFRALNQQRTLAIPEPLCYKDDMDRPQRGGKRYPRSPNCSSPSCWRVPDQAPDMWVKKPLRGPELQPFPDCNLIRDPGSEAASSAAPKFLTHRNHER